jgi:hypothetical protein
MSEISTPTGAQAPAAASASPFAAADQDEAMMTSIPLKPGGNHLKVCFQPIAQNISKTGAVCCMFCGFMTLM